VSIEQLGAAAGVTGPAVYRHFSSKNEVLADLLVGVSRRLLDGGREVVARSSSGPDVVAGLIAFHTRFALTEPELIRIQDHDLSSLAAADRRLVRQLQRRYVEVWVAALVQVEPNLPSDLARTKVQATFGLLNSTPHSVRSSVGIEAVRHILEGMAMAALTSHAG
jgi:AcrR family transcriptional regulator